MTCLTSLRSFALLAAASLLACTHDVVDPPRERQPVGSNVAAVVEITVRDIGLPTMSASALVASSVAELEALHARRAGDRASFDLTVPKNSNGSGNATIELATQSSGAVSANGFRYLQATFRVRNAQKTDSVAFNTPRQNLTFVPVSTANTKLDTPVLVFTRVDGTPADPSLLRQVKPTGLVTLGPGGGLVTLSPDVFQAMTEAEIAAITLPPDVTNTFPYGFIVRRAGSVSTRTLDPSPAPANFQGLLTIGFRIPLQTNIDDNPSTVSFMMLALDDSQTRLTQSLEEQNGIGRSALLLRATSLNALAIRLLPGGSVPGWPPAQTQLLCTIRTAGFAAAPTATLVDVKSSFVSLLPSPYSAAGSAVPLSAGFGAIFSTAVQGVGPTNFIVRGLESGQHFRGATYSNVGALVKTPVGIFLPGEEIEVVITSGASCPGPWVGRLRVRTPTPSSATITQLPTPAVGTRQHMPAVGDFNGDGSLDIAVANNGSDNVSILFGKGDGSFTSGGTFATGRGPVAIVTQDFNDDGILDLAVANAQSDDVSILLGNGDGTFAGAGSVPLQRRPTQLLVGDLNADGVPDLLASGEGASDLSVLLGVGNGSFRPQPPINTQRDARAIALGDVNNDGALDILVATTGNSNEDVTVLLGRNDGTFGLARSVAGGSNPTAIALGDMNGDGRLDIVTASNGGNDAAIMLGNGDGTFQAPTAFNAGSKAADAIAVGDMNGDGILDLVFVDRQDRVDILLGIGNGTFGPFKETTLSNVNPIYVTTADFNRDGILDLALGNDATSYVVLIGRP